MIVYLVEPFFTGSHQVWAEGLQRSSQHEIRIFSLQGRHWKWRMHGGAVSLAAQINAHIQQTNESPDLIVATDMIDLTTLRSLVGPTVNCPISIYFHENQITYPWSPDDPDRQTRRDNHYGFINYTSALTADMVWFNSDYHRTSFMDSLLAFLSQFPDHNLLETIPHLESKTRTLHLGMDLSRFNPFLSNPELPNDIVPAPVTDSSAKAPILLWNHRWEYDKNPEMFFETLFQIAESGIEFRLIVLGQRYKNSPAIFQTARQRLDQQIIHFGFADSFDQYATAICRSDILPVTSNQDFFGGSVVEAIHCGVIPLLPNRLAYPEHVDPDLYPDLVYESEQDFQTKLIRLITTIHSQPHAAEIAAHVGRYDWNRLGAIYDAEFASVRKASV